MASLKNTTVAATDSAQLPVGTTAQRPASPVNGDLRFNSTFKVVEYYNGSAWKYLPPVVEDGLVLRLDAAEPASYPGTGTNWNDLSSSNIDGTLTNSPTFGTSPERFTFFATNEYVETNNDLDPEADGLFADTGNAWSVSSWFRRLSNGAITSKAGGTGTSATYVVWMSGSSLLTRLRGGTILTIDSSNNSSLWYEVVITWDGTTARAYLNGSFVNTISVGAAAIQTSPFRIGASGTTTPNNYFDGNISDVKVYNRALTESEIQQNFNALRGRYGL